MTEAASGAPSADHPPHEHAVVFAGGDPPPAAVLPSPPTGALVVAADSGLDHALALGLVVDLVVGDLDSASPQALAAAEAAGAEVEVHPVGKDATDLELALRAVRDRGVRSVTVVGGGGGRHDHLLANALVLTADEFAGLEVDALVGTARLTVVRDRRRVTGRPGGICSLLPLGGPAHGVRTDGLRYPLDGEDLHPGSTRGISNELLGPAATVTLAGGVLLVVQPHALEEA